LLAAIYYEGQGLRLEEIEPPVIGEDEALLRVKAASVCGTDLKIVYKGYGRTPPGSRLIIGHEMAGDVEAVGSQVTALKPGMRVTLEPNVGCNVCLQCLLGNNHLCPNHRTLGISLDGAFTEYMRIPANLIRQGNVFVIPDNVSYQEAALVEPFACCYNGFLGCHIEPGDVVLIIGGGPIGVMHLWLAHMSGARCVIVSQRSAKRRALLHNLGADVVVNPLEKDLAAVVQEVSQGQGADVVIVAASSPEGQQQAIELAAPLGRISFFGGLPKGEEFVRINSNLVHYKQLIVTGTTGASNAQFHKSLEIVASRRVDLSPLISARFPLSQVEEALALAASKDVMKIVVIP
jgi:L-iditol 2-dehydrogenase